MPSEGGGGDVMDGHKKKRAPRRTEPGTQSYSVLSGGPKTEAKKSRKRKQERYFAE